MNASFEEKSVWIELIATVAILGGYFLSAARLLAAGVTDIGAYVPLFTSAIVLLIVVMVVGHIVVAAAGGPEGRDERDRLIEWRADSHSSWILAAGVLSAIAGLAASAEGVWIAHLLLLSLLLSEVTKFILQLVYYRRGV